MNLLPLAFIDEFAGAFGVAAAVLLIGTSFALRWQRNRHRFDLARIALETNATHVPQGPPFWIMSLRESLTILVLGIGLLGVGAVANKIGGDVPMPSATVVAASRDVSPPPPPPDSAEQGPARPPRPPPPNPELERWHAAQYVQIVGLAAMGCGAVLVLLGLVRLALSPIEKKYGNYNGNLP
jgi:hypothetical protein